jgi:Transcription elongation factor, GreA/GreB, C-term
MDASQSNPKVGLNCRVTVELIDAAGQVEQLTFALVASRQADLKSGLLDENTPLARALLDHQAGELIPYPVGDLRAVRILSVEPLAESVSPEAARKRKADVRKAAAQSEITSQMIFSTASGSKWGDYEVNMDKLLDEDEDKKDDEPEEKSA